MGEVNATVDVRGRTVRDVALELVGVDPTAGPLAYWRSHEIHAAVRAVRDQISPAAGGDLERWWASAAETERSAVIARLRVPEVVIVRRPWVDVRVLWGARIPYVPLAAFLHVMAAGSHRTVCEAAAACGIVATTTPWELLELVDDKIEVAPVPDDLPRVAAGLRLALNNQPDEEAAVHSPTRWLLENHGGASWNALAAVAETATAAENARQAQLRADRAARKVAS